MRPYKGLKKTKQNLLYFLEFPRTHPQTVCVCLQQSRLEGAHQLRDLSKMLKTVLTPTDISLEVSALMNQCRYRTQ